MTPVVATPEAAGANIGAGETDLTRLLAGLAPAVAPRPRAIRMQALGAPVPAGAILWFREDEAATVIVDVDDRSIGAGADAGEPRWAQVVLRIHSSLDAVGMMAAVSAALAERGIACNAVSAYFHDHLFVPRSRRDDALAALHALSARHASAASGRGSSA